LNGLVIKQLSKKFVRRFLIANAIRNIVMVYFPTGSLIDKAYMNIFSCIPLIARSTVPVTVEIKISSYV
jgi:hypothetical protein